MKKGNVFLGRMLAIMLVSGMVLMALGSCDIFEKAVTCSVCDGTGECQNCNGTGKKYFLKCSVCNGTGKCQNCDGTGVASN